MAKGKLKNLFKKKEGGTVLGNLLRKAGDTFTGGAYSSLFPKPTAADVAKQQGIALPEMQPIGAIGGMKTKGLSIEVDASSGTQSITKKGWFWPVVIGAPVAIIGLIAWAVGRGKNKNKR